MLYFHSWSGGKDSTASIILDHLNGLPKSKIIFSEVMFDNKRGISGELPEHIDFIRNVAIPKFESWGYEVETVRSEKDYLDLFYHKITKSNKPERIGKYSGFVLSKACVAQRELKVNAINSFYKNIKEEYTQYIGIALDEPERLERLRGTNKVSLLERYGYTEFKAYHLCKEHGLLSPIYESQERGGCWFCPNQKIREFYRLKLYYPELWEELRTLSKEDNVVSKNFKYNQTFQDVEEEIRKRMKIKPILASKIKKKIAKKIALQKKEEERYLRRRKFYDDKRSV